VADVSFSSGEMPTSGCRTTVGRLIGTLFFFVFFAAGCLVAVVIGREVLLDLATYRWQRADAVVVESRIVEQGNDEHPYQLEVAYRYRFDGVEYTGERVTRGDDGHEGYSDVQRDALRYRQGSEVDCYVNPDRPEEAVLVRREPWLAFMILLPLIFVAVGAIGMYAIWSRAKPKPETISISERAKPGRHALIPVILGAVFAVVGAVMFVVLGVLPAIRLLRASTWDEVPCRVVSSSVRSHSTDDGTTYSVDILYEYQFDGFALRSNRYDFANLSSSGHESKQEIVDRYPPGSLTVCYVDPTDPASAVLSRSFRAAYLFGLFPLTFLIVGIPVLLWGLRQIRRRPADRSPFRRPSAVPVTETRTGPARLEPRQTRAAKVFGCLIFALIWNGVVSVFLFSAIREWQRGSPDWFHNVFLIPFVLVGLGGIGGVVYFFLGSFNPVPTLELTPSPVRLGDSVLLEWSFDGRPQRIQHLRITFEGREEATYRRGTDTRTDKQVFARSTVVDTDIDYEISRGSRELHVPEDTMHSLDGGNNKIHWYLKIHGDVPRWPDVDEEHPVEILPALPEAMT